MLTEGFYLPAHPYIGDQSNKEVTTLHVVHFAGITEAILFIKVQKKYIKKENCGRFDLIGQAMTNYGPSPPLPEPP